MVRGLLEDGYRVSTCSRKVSKDIETLLTAPEFAGRFFWGPCQVGEEAEVDRFIEDAMKQSGSDVLWGLVNNAGIAQPGILTSFPNVESEKLLRVNLLGTLQVTRAASRYILNGEAGRIVNISSIIASRGYNGMSAYAASKAGMDGLTRSLARELGRRQVTVNSVAPGYVKTEMSKTLTPAQLNQIVRRTPLGRLATEDDILGAVRFLLSDAAGMITGQTLIVDGGVTV